MHVTTCYRHFVSRLCTGFIILVASLFLIPARFICFSLSSSLVFSRSLFLSLLIAHSLSLSFSLSLSVNIVSVFFSCILSLFSLSLSLFLTCSSALPLSLSILLFYFSAALALAFNLWSVVVSCLVYALYAVPYCCVSIQPLLAQWICPIHTLLEPGTSWAAWLVVTCASGLPRTPATMGWKFQMFLPLCFCGLSGFVFIPWTSDQLASFPLWAFSSSHYPTKLLVPVLTAKCAYIEPAQFQAPSSNCWTIAAKFLHLHVVWILLPKWPTIVIWIAHTYTPKAWVCKNERDNNIWQLQDWQETWKLEAALWAKCLIVPLPPHIFPVAILFPHFLFRPGLRTGWKAILRRQTAQGIQVREADQGVRGLPRPQIWSLCFVLRVLF